MIDEEFFATYHDRQARIREPVKELVKDKQRAVRFEDECDQEFRSLGDHNKDRRRILVWRVPADNPWYDPRKPPLLKIPMLLFSDETVEDNDMTLLPMIHEIMTDKAHEYAG
jgi:hypothetical protein